MKKILLSACITLLMCNCKMYRLTGVDGEGKIIEVYTKKLPVDPCDTLITEDGYLITNFKIDTL